jgi:hypothetical protein
LQLRPFHTTVRTRPYAAVREVTLTRLEQGWQAERFSPTLMTAEARAYAKSVLQKMGAGAICAFRPAQSGSDLDHEAAQCSHSQLPQPAGLKLEFGETRSLGVEVADTEGHSRVAGILGVLEQLERCLVILMPRSHSTAISGDRWPDDVRLSDVEPSFTCKTCGKRGADVRPDFDWNRQQPVAAMGYHWCPGPAASMYRSNCRKAANSERFLTLGVTLRLCPSPSTTAPSGRPQFIFC